MATKNVSIITLLLIVAMCCSIAYAGIIPVVNTPTINTPTVINQDSTAPVGLYKPNPCYACVVPTPAPVYEKVGISMSISPSSSTYKFGTTVTLSAIQTSGTTLGSTSIWAWDIPSGASSMARLNGPTVTTQLTKVGKSTIYIRVRDESKSLTGQAQASINVLPRA